jgi:fumarate hydratase subunit beta
MKKITLPCSKEQFTELRAGDEVLLSGTIFTARDAAHARMKEMLKRGDKLPINIEKSVIYYAGACPAKPGQIIGSCGPTTSKRMDGYSPQLFDMGLLATIGKGPVSKGVRDALKRNNAVYFCAVGGAGALIAKCVTQCDVIAFDDLGPEAIKKLEIKDMPVIVGADCTGNTIVK